jgi:hypothetical protein
VYRTSAHCRFAAQDGLLLVDDQLAADETVSKAYPHMAS